MNTLNLLGSMLSEADNKNHFFLMSDQPTTCPRCGCRTEITSENQEEEGIIQSHECLSHTCGFSFLVCEE